MTNNSIPLPELPNDDIDWFLRDLGNSRDGTISGSPHKKTSPSANDANHHDETMHHNNKSVSGNIPTSPHLTATISNTNDHIISKTRPTIGTIQEEPVLSPRPKSASESSSGNYPNINTSTNSAGLTRKRTNSVSSITSNTSTSSTSGFLGKLKGKFHKSPPTSPVIQPSVFKDNYNLNLKKSTSNELSRSLSNASYNSIGQTLDREDPRLEEYIKFYKKPDSASSSRRSSISEGCLLNRKESVEIPNSDSGSGTGSKLSSFLRRKSSNASTLPSTTIATQYNRRNSESANINNESKNSFPSSTSSIFQSIYSTNSNTSTTSTLTKDDPPILPEFKDLKPLKRVAFHSTTFLIDPPQQIPSRTPRRGNVEILPNGNLRINPLSEEDKLAIEKSQQGQGGGLVVGGTGSLGLSKEKANEERKDGDSDIKEEVNLKGNYEENADDEKIDKHAKAYGIDKPMFHNRSSNSYTVPVEKMALDLMYTRCCHLREILPIPAILKQIPKNSMAPIPLLQLRNPSPTMIEIQTFADFIRIAPIICISLDGVSLSLQQFKILLSAMSAKTQLEKLSLRNTPISESGWSLLCWFLSRNKVLSKLDITQCPPLNINILKRRKVGNDKKKKEDELERMKCNQENRSDMDWQLFIATIVARGGIEELILTGCCILDLTIFEKLIKLAVSIKTYRLGLAYNNISGKHCEILVKYWIFKPFVRGVDLGYNDFLSDEFFQVLVDFKKKQGSNFESLLEASQIGFLSLNSTNIRFSKEFKFIIEYFLIKLKHLRYLDISNNPKLFNNKFLDKSLNIESTESYFTSNMPLYSNLIRIHLENNELSSAQILAIADILPFCQHLRYISLLGNKIDSGVAAALVQAVKNSKKIMTLEADMDDVPSYFKERLGLYTMRNMEYMMYNEDERKSDKADAKGDNLTNQYYEVLELKTNNKLDLNNEVVLKFLNQAKQTKIELHDSINELNKLRLKNILNLEGKETLVRLLFIDSSISKAIKSIDENFTEEELMDSLQLSELKDYPSSSVSDSDDNILVPESTKIHTGESIKSPGLMSRTSSRTSLNQLEKEEGNVHKLHANLNKETLFNDSDENQLSGEEIRKKIAGVSLDQLGDIIKFVKQLKEKGIEVGSVFKEIHNQDGISQPLDIGFITHKLRSLSSGENGKPKPSLHEVDHHDEKDDKASSEQDITQNNDEDKRAENNDDKQANIIESTDIVNDNSINTTGKMNQLYDEVLHNYKIN